MPHAATLGCVPFIILCQPTTCFRALFKKPVDRKAIVNLTGRFIGTGRGPWNPVQLIKMELCRHYVHAWRSRKVRRNDRNLRSFRLSLHALSKLSNFLFGPTFSFHSWNFYEITIRMKIFGERFREMIRERMCL